MKKIALLFIAALFTSQSFTQPCPEGMIFESQEQIDNFPINYPNCTDIEGLVWIAGEDITNVDGLSNLTSIGDMLIISETDSILNLAGFSNLISVGSSLEFTEANILNLSGLDNLTSVGGHVSFYKCANLTSFEGLGSLSYIGNGFYIEQCFNITNLSGFDNLTTIVNDVEITRTSLVNFEGLNNLTTIGGDFEVVSNYDLINLDGLSNLISIGGDLVFRKMTNYPGNISLINLSGLNNLIRVGGNITIRNSDALIDLSGLNNLRTIWGSLQLEENHSLSSLTGLNNLDTLRFSLLLIDNENIANLSTLQNLSILGGTIWIQYADRLKSLEGLDNINPEWIYNLVLNGNDSLSICDVQSICDFLSEPDADYSISGNAEGCNSKDEIEIACETGGISDYYSVFNFSISPNPCSGSANLQLTIAEQGLTICDLFTVSGTRIKRLLYEKKTPGTYEMKIDLGDLPKGIYFCKLKTSEGVQTKKIIKL